MSDTPFGWFYELNADENPKAGPVYLGTSDQRITGVVAADEGAKPFPLYASPQPAGRQEPEVRKADPVREVAAQVCERLASMMEQGAGEPEPGARLRQAAQMIRALAVNVETAPQAIAAAPIATCKTSGMGLCEAREEGGSFCPGGRCLRYDAAPSPQPGPGELSDEQIDEALFDELGWGSGNKGWHVDGGWLLKSELRIAIRSILSLSKQSAVQADTVRLDWLEARWLDGVHVECCAANSGLTHHGLHPVATVYSGGLDGIEGPNIRAAIDAAMAGESRPSKGEGT